MNGDRIRELLDDGCTVLMPGVWDALSARLTAEAGFEVCFVSGYASSATQLGLPDFGYLTQTEITEVARRVCTAVPQMAVVVDGDTGHGNPLNTIRTVDLFERAGAGGIFLEDQVWPKKCGHMAGKTPLLTPAELHDLGYDLIVSPLTGLFAAARAMATAYQTLRERGSLRDHLDLVVTFDDFNRVVDLDRHYRLEATYVAPDGEESDTST